jgi:hypothetical protein
MTDNVATLILDDLTEFDVQKTKTEGDLRRRIAARMDDLERELRRLTEEIDPAGTPRRDAQIRRLAKLEKASREAVRQAYADINRMTRQQMVDMAGIESDAVIDAMGANIP